MTIRELIESNHHIGDLEIEVRKIGYLVDKWCIGYQVGHPTPYLMAWDKYDRCINGATRLDYYSRHKEEWKEKHSNIKRFTHYDDKPINAIDKGKEYYQLLINDIPKAVLEMKVFTWHSTRAFRGIDTSVLELDKIYITVEIGEQEVQKEVEKIKNEHFQDFQQLSFLGE